MWSLINVSARCSNQVPQEVDCETSRVAPIEPLKQAVFEPERRSLLRICMTGGQRKKSLKLPNSMEARGLEPYDITLSATRPAPPGEFLNSV